MRLPRPRSGRIRQLLLRALRFPGNIGRKRGSEIDTGKKATGRGVSPSPSVKFRNVKRAGPGRFHPASVEMQGLWIPLREGKTASSLSNLQSRERAFRAISFMKGLVNMGYKKTVVDLFLKLWPFTHLVKRLSAYTPFRQIFAPLVHDRILSAAFIPINEEIMAPESTVVSYDLLRELMEKSSVRFQLDHCICRNQENCRTYPKDLGCIFLGRAAADIHPSMGKKISVESAMQHLDRAKKAGLVAMVGRLWMDALSLGVLHKFHDFLVVCFCCDCCCLLRTDFKYAGEGFRKSLKRLEGIRVQISEDCIGCGKCKDECFMGAIEIIGGRALHHEEACKGCGRCASICPQKAVIVKFDRKDKMLLELFSAVEGTAEIS